MAHLINKIVNWDGVNYIILSYNEALDMFEGREVNRQYKTLIPSDLVLK